MKPTSPRRVVVDASVAVKFVVPEDYSEEAQRLLSDHLEGRLEAHAPSLLLLEAASALRKYATRGLIGPEEAREALSIILDAGLLIHRVDEALASRSLELSLGLGVTVYDAAYIALAEAIGAELYTADEKLMKNPAVQRRVRLRHIRDYPPEPPVG